MPFRDRYDLPLSSASALAMERYVEGIDRTLAGNAGADRCLEEAVAADEGFALAQIALARSEQFRGLIPQARERAARARALTDGVTPREQRHVETIATAIEQGGGPVALAAVKEHIAQYPRDAFVLSQASGVYGLIGFSGRQDRNEEQYALLDGVVDAYGDDWWFLSAYGFACTELFRVEEGRRLVERSLQIYDRNAHGAHALGHVFYETGDAAGGVAFLDPWIATYDRTAQLHGHLSWHLALFELAAGNAGRVMELYERNIGPRGAQSAPLGILADSASLLWRCDLYAWGSRGRSLRPEGVGEPSGLALERSEGFPNSEASQGHSLRWDEVRDLAARAFPRPGITFADVHAALAYAAARDQELLDRLTAGLRERAEEGKLPAGEGVVSLVQGIAAFARKDYDETVRQLEPVADQVIRIGGSHAQREVFEDTLLEAYLRTGRDAQAETLLRERLERRPSSRDVQWLERARGEVI
ncbi:MAG: tetratricopeptide repeat protein [Dehalococcoidia bacterium]